MSGAQPSDIARLRAERSSLKQLTRDLMVWIGLLRHKAMTLRVLTSRFADGLPSGLTPGSLDPRALASELASGRLRPAPAAPPAPTAEVADSEDVLIRARSLWETAADPSDPRAARRLSEASDAVAAQLEALVNEALDQYRRLGEQLIAALRRSGQPGVAADLDDDPTSET